MYYYLNARGNNAESVLYHRESWSVGLTQWWPEVVRHWTEKLYKLIKTCNCDAPCTCLIHTAANPYTL